MIAQSMSFGGFIGAMVGLLILSLGICWVIFPVIVLSKFNELLKLQREQTKKIYESNLRLVESEGHLRAMRKYYEPQPFSETKQIEGPHQESLRRSVE